MTPGHTDVQWAELMHEGFILAEGGRGARAGTPEGEGGVHPTASPQGPALQEEALGRKVPFGAEPNGTQLGRGRRPTLYSIRRTLKERRPDQGRPASRKAATDGAMTNDRCLSKGRRAVLKETEIHTLVPGETRDFPGQVGRLHGAGGVLHRWGFEPREPGVNIKAASLVT